MTQGETANMPPSTRTLLAIAFAISSGSNQLGTCVAFNTHYNDNSRVHNNRRLQLHAQLKLNFDNSNSDPSLPPPSVLCIGEALFDSLPTGIYLGGAPTNVAVHLASLFASSSQSTDPTVAVAACLGKDQLGKDAHRRLSTKGVRVDYIQFHHEWETGMSTAIIDEDGDATYEFNTPAAWDGLSLEERLSGLMQHRKVQPSTQVFVMGTIAGRLKNDQGATSFATLKTIRNKAPEGSVVLDVNLRSPWYTPESVLELAKGTRDETSNFSEEGRPKELALLKLNEEELCILEQWCGLKDTSSGDNYGGDALRGSVLRERMELLSKALNTKRVCVTRGKDGAALFCKGISGDAEFYENLGYNFTVNNDSDTVGAGDAFLAALVASLFIQGDSSEIALERACALGGYVAGCRGATPEHRDAPENLKSVFSLKPR
eukprot:CAMPEP_0172531168 /NCGR_PEP_ID=MMETSP1067-20121228/4677_1 /TAXON_ID=265564 ORGANISM="Thalassiosira punctigera, Strain Tpunct2005C2" /NCGR_SAMPLE_ID=MMETSP1067 /ASSEMBLY_ACC=CAM_ASM_000444 /LENGTH=430 /DNA_ID=CAMNT_0013315515 /DNA_START=24 /DNA_END=1316 /DNA_ORIENTATION=+